MNSKDWILNCDLSIASRLFLSDKETQTSAIYLINSVSSKKLPSRPLPQNIEAVAKDDNIKVYEHCEIIHDPDDPESVTIIKETFSEEVITESCSIFDTPTKNKYKYCKEVTQPYSKSYPKDCPSFAKCKPKCKDLGDQQSVELYPNDKEKTMNSDKCKTTFVNPNNKPDKCENKENKKKSSSCSSIESVKDEKPPCDKPKPPCCEKAEPFDDNKLKRCISCCISDSLKLAKKGSASCLEKFEKVIGIQQPKDCDEKPTYYVMKKSISQTDSSTSTIPKENTKSIFESHSQTVANITCAIKGFMGAVYNKTKEAVNMIKTESCRHLGIDETKSTSKENKSEQKTKECSSNVSEIKTESLIERIRSQASKAEDPNESTSERYDINKILEPAKEVFGQVSSAVDSTISILRNSSFEKIVDDILEGKLSKSSAYDDPDAGKRTPKKIAQDHEPETNSSVFTMIKAKFLSMFDIQQDTCQDDDNNDDDDSSAEKLFDKYCEQ